MNFLEPWTATSTVPAVTPRDWQREAFNRCRAHLSMPLNPSAVVRAIMGSGKSLLIAELCARAIVTGQECIVVSTSTQLLVRQLYGDIFDRCGPRIPLGAWYTERHRIGQVNVTCTPSVPALAAELQKRGMGVALWIADELHRTECPTILSAYSTLSPRQSVGFSATPYRADENETISLFRTQIYDYPAIRALEDGIVVPWKIIPWESEAEEADLDTVCLALAEKMEGPGLFNSRSIADAEAFAQKACAGVIHSRQRPAEQREAVAALKDGRVKALVHVNMLAEGANYPWLRWLCLRRDVQSRVRFLQEIGRVLRAFPNKAEAIFLDPLDLFGSFRVSYPEALGDRVTDCPEEIADDPPAEVAEKIGKLPPATALRVAEVVVRRLVVAAESSGMIPDRKIMPRAKRRQLTTPFQQAAIHRYAEAALPWIPDEWFPLLGQLKARASELRRGFASDLIAVFIGIHGKKRFPPLDELGRIHAGMQEQPKPAEPEPPKVLEPKYEQPRLPGVDE